MSESIYVTAVNGIEKGETRSFGEVAALAGKPRAARAAGRALTHYPAEGKAAWQRAVSSDGGLSIDPERAALQLERLRRDGARPRAGESVARWARRVRAPWVGNWRNGQCCAADDPRAETFDTLFVERLESETAARERGFTPAARTRTRASAPSDRLATRSSATPAAHAVRAKRDSARVRPRAAAAERRERASLAGERSIARRPPALERG